MWWWAGRIPGLIASLPGLEVVLSLNAGVEHLLASGEAGERLPIVRMVDPGLVEGMVEWVAAQVLAWHRNLFAYRDQQGQGVWAADGPRRWPASGPWRCWAPARWAPRSPAMLAHVGVQAAGLEPHARARFRGLDQLCRSRKGFGDCLAGADVLVNLLPSTAQTRDLIDAEALLARLAPGAFLVNAGPRSQPGRRRPAGGAGQRPAQRRGARRVPPGAAAGRPFRSGRHPRVLTLPPRRRPHPCAHRGGGHGRGGTPPRTRRAAAQPGGPGAGVLRVTVTGIAQDLARPISPRAAGGGDQAKPGEGGSSLTRRFPTGPLHHPAGGPPSPASQGRRAMADFARSTLGGGRRPPPAASPPPRLA